MSTTNPATRVRGGAASGRFWIIAVTCLLCGVGLGILATWYVYRAKPPAVSLIAEDEASPITHAIDVSDPEAQPQDMIEVPESQWSAMQISVAPAQTGQQKQSVRLTGKVSLNQDRIAHIYPMVTGAVEKVLVTLGQAVKRDELLAIINSREVGEAKLELYQAKLQHEMSLVKYRLQEEVSANTKELLTALRERKDITSIESLFRSRTMGDYRERLLASYSNYLKSQADVDRLEGITNSGAVSGSQLLTATANRNADLATFQSRIEQIDYEVKTSLLLASQAAKEAETRVAVAATNLKILGCSEEEIESADPAKQGESIAYYSVRAPFDGTVITKDVVLREQVRPDVMVFGIADLSSVWISADIYEKHIPLLSGLANQTIEVRSEAFPETLFHAKTFYTGEVMDESTRTISLTAVADNSEGLLKPGMFVSIELPGNSQSNVTQVPASAIQEHDGKKFVFVYQDGKFWKRDIVVGVTSVDQVVVLEGLSPGENIAISGGFILKSKMLAELMGEE